MITIKPPQVRQTNGGAQAKQGVGAVSLMRLDESDQPKEYARFWLEGGELKGTDSELLRQWDEEGIVGRSDSGRLFPRDGQRFLDELPFCYRSHYLWAKPEGLLSFP